MRRRERFGKLVLLDELEEVYLGTTHLAARLGPSGLDRIVTLLRFSEAVSAHPDVAARLLEQARQVARLGVRGLVQILGIGRVGSSYYATYELIEGRSLRTVIDRSRRDGFPFTVENVLMVASRAAAVLEALHARKGDGGGDLFHGLLAPSGIVVSWEGEVRLREVGLWPALHGSELLEGTEGLRLSPEQRAGGHGEPRSDVHALGLILLEMLTGWSPDGSDPVEAIDRARHSSVTGEEEPIPGPIRDLLRRALAHEPSSRFEGMAQMRQAIDTLLFSGDFTPTTFNLAFFMQTLFREDMEQEGRSLAEARQADYGAFLTPPPEPSSTSGEPPALGDAAPPREGLSVATADGGHPTLAARPPTPVAPPAEVSTECAAPPATRDSDATPSSEPGHRGARGGGESRLRMPSPGASGRMFASASKRGGGRRALALVVGLVAAVILGGGVGYLYFLGAKHATPPAPGERVSPEAEAALARVRELEARLAKLEREKAELEAVFEETSVGERDGVDPAPVRSGAPGGPRPGRPPEADVAAREGAAEGTGAQEAARRRAPAERARQEQIRQLDEEIRAAQRRLVSEQQLSGKGVDLEASLEVAAQPMPTPELVSPRPVVVPGQLVDADDPEVTLPELVDEGPAGGYPEMARIMGRRGRVVVEALVDEKGRVLEARTVESSTTGLGFEEAAERKVLGRRYRPARKNDVPVRVRIRVAVQFIP
jgi:TonB family protein